MPVTFTSTEVNNQFNNCGSRGRAGTRQQEDGGVVVFLARVGVLHEYCIHLRYTWLKYEKEHCALEAGCVSIWHIFVTNCAITKCACRKTSPCTPMSVSHSVFRVGRTQWVVLSAAALGG